MAQPGVDLPEVVSAEKWEASHKRILAMEKEAMRASDALAAERRRQPMVLFRSDYLFEGPEGQKTLPQLFDGSRQLIVYHFMLDAGADPCVGCSMFTDQVPNLNHLRARDTNFVLASRAPVAEIEAVRDRMDWDIPWYSTGSGDFPGDCGITGGFGFSVFVRDDDDRVYRSYFTTSRGVEAIGTVWAMLDRTPFGRQEEWEDSPEGRPQGPPYRWWNLHDSYS